jgi:hypothetical protein
MRALLALVTVASLALSGWLLIENGALRAELAATRAAAPVAAPAPVNAEEEAEEPAAEAPGPATAGRAAAVLGFVGRALNSPAPAAEAPAPDFDSRRARRQKRLRDLLGRGPAETEEQYRARVAPLVAMTLIRPRQRLEDKRTEFETAAEVSPEQRGELDRAIADARTELVTLASQAVASGELTPYRRNSVGLLNFVGGVAGIADGFDVRVRGILGAEQLGLLEQTGFDLIEYLGFTTPWESVTPPPPAPNL